VLVDQIRKRLAVLQQESLGAYLGALSQPQLARFLSQINTYDHALLQKQRECIAHPPKRSLSGLQAPTCVFERGNEQHTALGEKLLAAGKAGTLILAGGQGTRLGWRGPKGTFPITPVLEKSLFQYICERARAASLKAGQKLPLAIMTSPHNHVETLTFFQTHDFFGMEEQIDFFQQGMLPLLDEKGNWLLGEDQLLAEGPDGNGNALYHFYHTGIWEKWRQLGIEFLNVIFVDNPLADPFDAEFLGFTADKQLDIGIKAVERLSPQEQVGVLVQNEEKLCAVEYSELSESDPAAATQFPLANIGIFCLTMEFIRDKYAHHALELPWHLAKKKLGITPIWKFETFFFDLLEFTTRTAILKYPRELTYAPLKSSRGERSVDSVRAALQAFDRMVYQKLSGRAAPELLFELDPILYYPTEALKKMLTNTPEKIQEFVMVKQLQDRLR